MNWWVDGRSITIFMSNLANPLFRKRLFPTHQESQWPVDKSRCLCIGSCWSDPNFCSSQGCLINLGSFCRGAVLPWTKLLIIFQKTDRGPKNWPIWSICTALAKTKEQLKMLEPSIEMIERALTKNDRLLARALLARNILSAFSTPTFPEVHSTSWVSLLSY